ncbi:MAG: Smr/MutS family protein [Rubrivivax sp.]
MSRAADVTALKDFEALGAALKRRAKEAAAQAARERARQAAEEAERRQRARQRDEFARAVGPVIQVPDKGLADLKRPRPAPEPVQRQLDEQQALQEALSDEVDIESLLLTDDGLSFRRHGIGPDVVTRLRRGHWAIQSQIDLHGLRRDEAREALIGHIREALRRGHRCVRVVHGKGHGSPGRQPVLKAKVQRWLGQSAEVVAFAQASGPQGGAGALIVLLKG